MHRKADDEPYGGAMGEEDNAARRRLGAAGGQSWMEMAYFGHISTASSTSARRASGGFSSRM